MAARKGHKKVGGRQQGTANRVTADVKERIKQFIEAEFDNVVDDFKGLEAKDKVQLFERFLAYIIPKQKDIDVTSCGQSIAKPVKVTPKQAAAFIKEMTKDYGKC